RRQDRELSPLSAHTVECKSTRCLRHGWTVRGCGTEHADLRREQAGQVQRHRYHARRKEFRSLSAVRCAYVSGKRQAAEGLPLADVRPWQVGDGEWTEGQRSKD